MRVLTLACVLACSIAALTQAQAPAQPAAAGATAQAPDSTAPLTALPVRRVILYKTGVGYFEHLGTVRNRQNVTVRFTSAQLNDVLKSLTVLDLGKGQVTGISYNSVAPLEQRLGALRLPLGDATTALQMLGSLRGARVEVTSGASAVEGRLLSVEQRPRQRDGQTAMVDTFSIVTDSGELRNFELTPAVRIRVIERDLRQEIGRYLDLVGSAREQDVRSMSISTSGTGDRPLFVSYVSEVPVWKTTYRLVLSAKAPPLLQGWAIVDNTIGEDWRDVELSLVAGAPQSFIQNISQPYYGQRPVVPMPRSVLTTPQTHQATLERGTGIVSGTVRDVTGTVIPGATVRLIGPSGTVTAVTDRDGHYSLSAPPGTYQLRFELSGFAPRVLDRWQMPAGTSVQQDVTLQVAGLEERLSVDGLAPQARRSGVLGGVVGGLPDAPPPPPAPAMAPSAVARDAYSQASAAEAMAQGAALGDLFQYRIKEPVTLRKNQSALVPIVNAPVEAEKVSLWNRAPGSGRPLRAVWITNGTGLTLDGGSMTLVDGDAFAGEGLIEALKPGERRLLSYAADLGVMVDARMQDSVGGVSRIRALEGTIVQENIETAVWTYKARNENDTATTLVIEHRMRPGWALAEGQRPAETTAGASRFRLPIEPAREASLEVREVRRGETRITITDIDEGMIAFFSKSGIPAAEIEKALKPVIEKRARIHALDLRLGNLQQERETIVSDQNRLRENMKALRGSAEERQLLQRYTRQLDEQETRLEQLQAEIARTTVERDTMMAELMALARAISFDIRPSAR